MKLVDRYVYCLEQMYKYMELKWKNVKMIVTPFDDSVMPFSYKMYHKLENKYRKEVEKLAEEIYKKYGIDVDKVEWNSFDELRKKLYEMIEKG